MEDKKLLWNQETSTTLPRHHTYSAYKNVLIELFQIHGAGYSSFDLDIKYSHNFFNYPP